MPTLEVRAARIAAGVCVYGCGEPRGTGLACPTCATEHAQREAQRRARHRQSGICVDCCRAPVVPGRYRCAACVAAQAERMRISAGPGRAGHVDSV